MGTCLIFCAAGFDGLLKPIEADDFILAADGGLSHVEKLGLTPYIEGHLCYGDTGTTKGQTIRTLIERHNIGSCIYVGDTQGDYEATLEAGVPFIWASYGFGNPKGYTAKVSQFEDLLNL